MSAFEAAVLERLTTLSAQVGDLQGQCRTMLDQHHQANASRAAIHVKLDAVTQRVGVIERRIDAIEPLVTQHEQEALKKQGERRLIGRVSGAITRGKAAAAAAVAGIGSAIAYLTGHLPSWTR